VETVSDTESGVALVTAPLGPSRIIADWPRRFSRGSTRSAPPRTASPGTLPRVRPNLMKRRGTS
jgi:hypothetical protein